jgi:hypothetical protein
MRSNPLALKKLFDEAGITMIDVSNGARGQSTNFIVRIRSRKRLRIMWRSRVSQPFSATHWKCNMGARPAGGRATSASGWPTR